MSELETASEHLEAAAEATGGAAASDRLADLAGQLSKLATADHGADHGRLARIQSALNDLENGDAADVADDIEAADDAINEYRSDLEGV
jgi:tRNA A22 N-methylase